MMSRNDHIRSLYHYMNDSVSFVLNNSTCTDPVKLRKSMQKLVRYYRDQIKSYYLERPDRLAKPLTEDSRFRYDDDGEGYTEYLILPEDGYTSDEEIRDYLDEYVKLPEICSPYDCTGKCFTMWISWKRTKAGIAVVHRVGLDV